MTLHIKSFGAGVRYMDRDEKNYFENVLESVIVVDTEGKIRELNNAALKLLDYERKEDLIMSPMKKICKNFSSSYIMGKIPLSEQELIYLNRHGKEILMSANIIDRIGYPEHIILMARDISKMKRLIEQLTKSKEQLQNAYVQLQDGKDELVRSEKLAFTGRIASSIAHEIRNPLSNIVMSIQQLKKVINPEDLKNKHIEIIERNAERVNYLITELIDCARPPKLELKPYDIHRLMDNVLGSTQHKIISQRISVIKRFTSESSIITMDNEHIERVFLNITLNAIDAMPGGGELTIVTETDENFFVVKIQDTGEGIPEEDIIRIFDPFFSTKAGGVGLGLTVCYGIVVSHGGTIEVESKPKEGSIFTVSLPSSRSVDKL